MLYDSEKKEEVGTQRPPKKEGKENNSKKTMVNVGS